MTGPERRSGGGGLVTVRDVRSEGDRVEGVVHVGTTVYPVHITVPGRTVRHGADPFVPLALLPAMMLRADLQVEGPVTPETIAAALRVQAQFVRWFPDLRPVRVEAGPRVAEARPPGVASLFSGGVDSFHTVLQNEGRLSHLLFTHGFDVPLGDHSLRASVGAAIRLAAADLGLPLIEVETNLRDFVDRYVAWELSFGAAITAVAMALGRVVGELRIPSSSSPAPQGSHPDLDPLWTTPEQAFVHDGGDVSRLAKIASIASSETALRYLRVCWRNPDGAYNCGRCEKCLRTMTALHLVGASGRCPTLPEHLEPTAVRQVAMSGLTRSMWEEMRDAARQAGDEVLASSISAALFRYRARSLIAAAVSRYQARPWVVRIRRVLRRVPGARRAWAHLHR